MNFRRQPFQFSSIDPLRRQAELQKRFGIPSSDMVADCLNPNLMGSGKKDPSSMNSSPSLQCKVPIFTQNAEQGIPDLKNGDNGHKPKVRVVPIHIEGVDDYKRHRSFSGPSVGEKVNKNAFKAEPESIFKPKASVIRSNGFPKPKVCNIPIKVEHRDEKSEKTSSNIERSEPTMSLNSDTNNRTASKKTELNKSVPNKQIEAVINKLKLYKEEVEKFSGTSKDKQYRYLDEMLTRCMLDLDNVETMGKDDIRKARKEAVKQVQFYVDLLDSKVSAVSDKMDTSPIVNETTNNDPTLEISEEMEITPNEDVSLKEKTNVNSEAEPICQTDIKLEPNDSTVTDNVPDVEMQDSEVKCYEVESGIVIEELVSEDDQQSSDCKVTATQIVSLPSDVSDSDSENCNKMQSDVVIAEVEENSPELNGESVCDRVEHSNVLNNSSVVDAVTDKISEHLTVDGVPTNVAVDR